ncbi:hypothetical protein [Methanofollis tationis]|uniref:Uncharacterized protein n=1 Tax=Methanofollis tationis TaxID=81417 RepID=A0A7K4HKP5_9EURY|nr:hypothetical protein [Methanofollis tationis]NVO65833.1 hypothetical protein [Methanofollis tationis]
MVDLCERAGPVSPAFRQGGGSAGFGARVIGNVFWVAYGAVTGNPYVVVMFGFYWVMAVVGVVNAGKEGT